MKVRHKRKRLVVDNSFCPTGEGGGVDPTCSPSSTGHLREYLTDLATKSLNKRDKDSGLAPHDTRKCLDEWKKAINLLPDKVLEVVQANVKSVHFAVGSSRLNRLYTRETGKELKTEDIGGVMSKEGKLFLLASKFGHGLIEHELGHATDPNNVHSHSKEWIQAWNKEVSSPDVSPLSTYAKTSPSEGFAEFARAAWASKVGDVGNISVGKKEISAKTLEENMPLMSAYFKKHGFLKEQTTNEFTVNPFVSEAQRRACYAQDDPAWDCSEWSAATPKGEKLPEKKPSKRERRRATHNRREKGINPLKVDPTRTITMRRQMAARLKQQFARLRLEVVRLLVDDDVLGLRVVGNAEYSLANNTEDGLTDNYDPNQPRDDHGRFGSGVGPSPIKATFQALHERATSSAKSTLTSFTAALDRVTDVPVLRQVKAAMAWSTAKTKELYAPLENRYGRTTAIGIMASAQVIGWGALGVGMAIGVPIYLPGVSLWGTVPAAAMAETYLQAKKGVTAVKAKLTGNEEELSEEQLHELARQLVADFDKAYLDYLRARASEIKASLLSYSSGSVLGNAFCPTGEGGGVDPSCSPDHEDKEALASKHQESSRPNSMTPWDKPLPREGEFRIAPDNGEVEQFHHVNLAELHLTEAEGYIKHREDYQQYVEWFKEGKQPPPISVGRHADSGNLISSDRRRVMAAREAGWKTIPAWVGVQDPGKPGWGLTYEQWQAKGRPTANSSSQVTNAFCPTGEGGGIDPSCSPSHTGSLETSKEGHLVTVLHGTIEGNVRSILKTGIEMRHPSGKGGNFEGNEDLTEQPKGVYCSQDEQEAAKWANIVANEKAGIFGHNKKPAIFVLECHVPSSAFLTGKKAEEQLGEAKVLTQAVSPGSIKSITFYEQVVDEDGSKVLRKGETKKIVNGKIVTDAPTFKQRVGGALGKDYLPTRLEKHTSVFVPMVVFESVVENALNWGRFSHPEKVDAFQQWLSTQVGSLLTGQSQEDLWKRYTETGFRKGAGRAFDDTRARVKTLAAGSQRKLDFYAGTREEFLKSAFAQPVAVDKVKLLAGRAFDDLEGVTDDMSLRMSRSLTDGLVQGKSPREIARDMNADVDVGEKRALVIARTEIIRAHADGQLEALDQLGVEEVGVAVEWSTTGDDKVCELCEAMEGVVLKLAEAQGMIPRHPSCRCSFLPANVGEDDADQKGSKRSIDRAVASSAAKASASDEWAGLEVSISKSRPQSILNYGVITYHHVPPTDSEELTAFSQWLVANSFCPTGDGGGVDPSCSPGASSGVKASGSKKGVRQPKAAKIDPLAHLKRDVTTLSDQELDAHVKQLHEAMFGVDSNLANKDFVKVDELHHQAKAEQTKRGASQEEKILKDAVPDGEIAKHGMPYKEPIVSVYRDGVHFSWTEYAGDRAAKSVVALTKSFPEMPKVLRDSTHHVVFCTQRNKDDDHWQRIYNNPEHISHATGGDGTIVVYRGEALSRASFAHESGHNLATKLWGNTFPSATSAYSKAQSLEKPVSAYGANSHAEDFAEACRMYAGGERGEHERLKTDFPHKYKALKELLG